MHRKQAQGQGSHESREPKVSPDVMRPYRVLHGQTQGSHESQNSGYFTKKRPGLARSENKHRSKVSRCMRTCTESKHSVEGLTSHETPGPRESETLSGLAWTECKHRVNARVTRPWESRVMRPWLACTESKHRVECFTRHETPGSHES